MIFLARFLGGIFEGEFWDVNFSRVNFSGGLFCWKKQSQKIRPKNSGPKFGRPKFVSQNSALNSGSGGAKSPVQTFVPEQSERRRGGFRTVKWLEQERRTRTRWSQNPLQADGLANRYGA